MKSLLTLGAVLSLALAVPAIADEPTAPKAPEAPAQADPNIYWDAKLVEGSTPYTLVGKDLTGKDVGLDNYKGKVVLLDFWATWCGPCVAELPNVISNYGKYHDQGFEILGISNDQDKEKLTKFIADRKMPWAQVYERDNADKASNTKNYGVRGIPFMLIIGKDGKIAAVNPRGEALEPAIKAALAK